jgi:hypothetical protein
MNMRENVVWGCDRYIFAKILIAPTEFIIACLPGNATTGVKKWARWLHVEVYTLLGHLHANERMQTKLNN